jgi:hypothetical protein
MISSNKLEMNPGPVVHNPRPTLGEFSNSKGKSGAWTIKSSTQWLNTTNANIMLSLRSLIIKKDMETNTKDQNIAMNKL